MTHSGAGARVSLADFKRGTFDAGRRLILRVLWLTVSAWFFETGLPWPSWLKVLLLRAFGARVGAGSVIKPHVRIKLPWRLQMGDHCWIGEGVWIDNLAQVKIGDDVCLSQGCTIETGNHDWSDPAFRLVLGGVTIESGAWVAVRAVVLPGSWLATHAVLTGGAVLAGPTEPYGVYAGNPSHKVHTRRILVESEAQRTTAEDEPWG